MELLAADVTGRTRNVDYVFVTLILRTGTYPKISQETSERVGLPMLETRQSALQSCQGKHVYWSLPSSRVQPRTIRIAVALLFLTLVALITYWRVSTSPQDDKLQ